MATAVLLRGTERRLRQEVLEGLGWRIHRVWSTDWFRNPERELRRLVEALEVARIYAGNGKESGTTTSNGASEIARDERADLESFEVATLPPYEMANPHLTGSNVADWVAEIVRVESPVHVQEVSRRITKAASIKRTGSRIRAAIEYGCDEVVRKGTVRRSGEFLWRPDMRKPPLKDRSALPDAAKKVELVPPEEIAAAIEKVVADSFGMDRGEIPAAVLRLLLGFRRTTEAAQRRVTEVLDSMIARKRLVEEGSQVSLKG